MRGLKLLVVPILVLVIAVLVVLGQDGRRKGRPRQTAVGKVLIGVLGDSDSAAYQDHLSFPVSGKRPGGDFHAITLQWPEALAKIRERQVDLGEWTVWGVPRWASVARARDGLYLPWRGPRRETNQNNLAWPSGCESLTTGPWRQVQRLVDVMDEQPKRWESGVVVIRMGVNNFGKDGDLTLLSVDPNDPSVVSKMNDCVGHYRDAVNLIHARHPSTKIVLVGIYNNADWAPYHARWQSKTEQTNLNQGLDHFDNALRSMAREDPRLAFFDDRGWSARHWGGRDVDSGRPNYRSVRTGEILTVTNTVGDHPGNATLTNLHNGLVWNLLWSQELVHLMRRQFGTPIDAITDDDIAQYMKKALGSLPAGGRAGH